MPRSTPAATGADQRTRYRFSAEQPSPRLRLAKGQRTLQLELSRLSRLHEFHSRIVSDDGANVCFARRFWKGAIVHWNNYLRFEITIHRKPRHSHILSVGHRAASHQDNVGMIEFLDQ